MKYQGRLTYDWKPWPNKPTFVNGPEMDTRTEAEHWLIDEIEKTYPDWKANGEQYVHVNGHAGDPVLGYVNTVYNEEEKEALRLREEERARLELLKPRVLNEGHKIILRTLASGKTLDDLPPMKDEYGRWVVSIAECKDMEEWGYMQYIENEYPHNRLTQKGIDAAKSL